MMAMGPFRRRQDGASGRSPGGGGPAPYLRRVEWVRLEVESGRPVRAEAVGVAHRLPVTVPISLHRAAELAANGVPVVTHRARTGSGAGTATGA